MGLKRPGAVSRSTLKRLPLYLHLLENLYAGGGEYVSCTAIAREFDLDRTQVRKDIEATGVVGTPRVGFRVGGLIERIRGLLGWDRAHEAVVVGTGNLGKALLGYKDFEKYGLKIIAAFDSDPGKICTRIFGREIFAISRLPALVKRQRVRIGIVAVPAEHAQAVVDLMVGTGITAIWNFVPAPLRIPKGIILENARLTQSLAVLTSKLTRPFSGVEG